MAHFAPNNSGSLATLTAMRLASSKVSTPAMFASFGCFYDADGPFNKFSALTTATEGLRDTGHAAISLQPEH